MTLPPGRARLATRPASTGSEPRANITMGIVLVAFFAAWIVIVPPATTMISTLRRIRSATSSAPRSTFPSPYRYSTAMFWPSIWPRSRRAIRMISTRLLSPAASPDDTYPIKSDLLRLLRVSNRTSCQQESY